MRQLAAERLGQRLVAVRRRDPDHRGAGLRLRDQVGGDLIRAGLGVEHDDLHVGVVEVRQYGMVWRAGVDDRVRSGHQAPSRG